VFRGKTKETHLEPSAILQLPFSQALDTWLREYRIHISVKTCKDYAWDIRALSTPWRDSEHGENPFLELALGQVKADHMHTYQRKRLLEDKLARTSVNAELDFLRSARRKLRRPVHGYNRLKIPFVVKGRVLTDEERRRILELAASNPNWMGAYLYLLLSLNTTCGPKECFTIRLTDCHLEATEECPWGFVEVGLKGLGRMGLNGGDGAKNDWRPRRCALNRESRAAVQLAIERAQKLGARDPEHYIFPFRISRYTFDPSKHITSIKTAWRSLRRAAGMPKLRPYDCRHHSITCLLENAEVSDQTVEEMCGHIDPRTKRYYSAIRMKQKAKAAAALCGDRLPAAAAAAREENSQPAPKKAPAVVRPSKQHRIEQMQAELLDLYRERLGEIKKA
jgi:integrase